MVELSPDFTLMQPFGGPASHGFDPSPAHLAELAAFFRGGSATLEVAQSYAVAGMVVLVFVERHARAGRRPAGAGLVTARDARSIAATATPGASCIGTPTRWLAASSSTEPRRWRAARNRRLPAPTGGWPPPAVAGITSPMLELPAFLNVEASVTGRRWLGPTAEDDRLGQASPRPPGCPRSSAASSPAAACRRPRRPPTSPPPCAT